MIKINVITNNIRWFSYIKKPSTYIDRRIERINKKNEIFKKKELFCSLLLSGDGEIKNLNKKFRKKNKTTDVLSFPFNYKFNKNSYLGDIAISYEIVNKRSIKSNFFLEFDKMWIHGYFHLNGYDHKKLKDYKRMNKKENLVLKFLHKLN